MLIRKKSFANGKWLRFISHLRYEQADAIDLCDNKRFFCIFKNKETNVRNNMILIHSEAVIRGKIKHSMYSNILSNNIINAYALSLNFVLWISGKQRGTMQS